MTMRNLALIICTLTCTLTPCTAQALRDPLIGTVTNPDGEPIAGVKVEVWRAGGRGTNLLDLDYKHDFRRIGVTPTDRSGRFALQLPVGLSCRVVVDQAPFAVWLREDCLPGEDLDIQLQRPAIFRGTLTNTDGTPATAALRAWSRDHLDEVFRGRTDDQGRFRFDRTAPGPLRVEIAPDRVRAPNWFDVDLISGQDYVHDVQLEPGVRLVGRVTDRTTGKPIAGARIGEGWTLFRAVETDADGRYEMPGYGTPGRVSLHCVAPGYVKQEVARPDPLPDPWQLDLRLERGQRVSGRIVDEAGEPFADVYVQAFGFVADSAAGMHDCVAMRTDADGRFDLAGLSPTVQHGLVVRRDGCAMLVYALPPADDAGVKHADRLTLPRARVVRGLLTDANGEPVANARVVLIGYNADRDVLLDRAGVAAADDREPLWRRLDLYLGYRRTRTDHLGRFAFGDVSVGSFHIEVQNVRFRKLAESAVFDVTADGEPEPVSVRIAR